MVDLWDGDSRMHFGTCKIPLNMILRQGKSINHKAFETDICEERFGGYVGGLQILLINEGTRTKVEGGDDEFLRGSPLKTRIQPRQSYGSLG